MPKPLLSPADWYASLPTFYAAAAMLITDRADRVLLVKPNYRPFWGLPGGIVEADEAPHEGVTREIAEELSLDIPAGQLLVIDWARPDGERPRGIANFIFDGGTISDPSIIRLQAEELDDAQFLTWKQAESRVAAFAAARIPAARQARQTGRAVYLPGRPLPGRAQH
jgi:ADP-ribose pyrophosphatase YjhB (NUDIX family)